MAGIYLAAGRNKGEVSGRTASLSELERCRLDPLIVVVRADDNLTWLPAAPEPRSTRRTETCLTAHLGLSFSLRCGLNAVSPMQPDAVVIALADQPFIPALLVDRLIDVFEQNPGLDYVTSTHEGAMMLPAVFAKSLFTELQEMDSNEGITDILRSPEYKGMMLQSGSAHTFMDTEQPGEFGELRREWSVRGGD